MKHSEQVKTLRVQPVMTLLLLPWVAQHWGIGGQYTLAVVKGKLLRLYCGRKDLVQEHMCQMRYVVLYCCWLETCVADNGVAAHLHFTVVEGCTQAGHSPTNRPMQWCQSLGTTPGKQHGSSVYLIAALSTYKQQAEVPPACLCRASCQHMQTAQHTAWVLPATACWLATQ